MAKDKFSRPTEPDKGGVSHALPTDNEEFNEGDNADDTVAEERAEARSPQPKPKGGKQND